MPQTTLPRIWLRRGLRVEHASGRNRADHARDPDDTDFLVNLHLGKHGRMCVVRSRIVGCGVGGFFLLDAVDAAMAHDVGNRHRTRRVLRADNHPVRQPDLMRRGVRERRIRHLLRQVQKLVADCAGGRRDPVRYRGRDPRSAFDRRFGRVELPSLMLMLSSGSPSMSAATCAMIV